MRAIYRNLFFLSMTLSMAKSRSDEKRAPIVGEPLRKLSQQIKKRTGKIDLLTDFFTVLESRTENELT